jgi:protein-tyrosine phosphatase
MIRVLFVCLGNICRSPALEATLRKRVLENGLEEEIEVDSCAMGSWFLTSKADPSMVEAAKRRGVTIDSRAKLFSQDFFTTFDYIFAVDNRILDMLKSMETSKKRTEKIYLATAFAHRYTGREIPDPYLGDERGFERTMDIVEDACLGIVEFLVKQKR